MTRHWFLPAAAVVAAAALSVPARAEKLTANYALSIIGLSIGNAYASAAIDPAAYHVDIGVKLSGLAAMVTNAKGAATASGSIANAVVLPAAYANTSANSQETRTVRMGLDAGTVRALDVQPPFPDMDQRVPISESLKKGILDPVSALVMRVPDNQPLVGPSACDRTLPIFDGLVRFDVTLTYVGMKDVKSRGYSGPVSICSARYTPLGGYKRDSSATRYMANNRDMEVWLAPVDGAHVVVPFHIAIRTSAGMLQIQAVDFKIGQ